MLRAALVLAFALVLSALPVAAQPLEAVQTVEKVIVTVNADGSETETLEPTEALKPGERLQYTLTFRNAGEAGVDALSPTMAVPPQVIIEEGSVRPAGERVVYSADGGETFADRAALTVVENGTPRPAEAADITTVRWVLSSPLPAGGSGTVSYRAAVR